MRDRESTARARELGSLLRRLREKAGIQAIDLAAKLGWSPTKVSRVETGSRGIAEIDVVRFAAYCGATHYQVNAMVARCREAEVPGYWLTDRLSSLVFHESTANSLVSYQPLVVPGLLQTFDYAMALIGPRQSDLAMARHHVEIRMERQQILHDRQLGFFIHEQALRLLVGDSRVMNEQLLKLVLIADHPWLSIRVVPASAGARSMHGGQFVLYRFPAAQPLVYLENGPLGLFLEASEYVAWYQKQVATIGEVALDRGQSREMLAALASEFDRPEDSRDAPDHLAEEQP